ncbi:MAG: AtpZ/AtpI family protein [Akkermansiaceae bacterium]|nr:AtpZ/AtpI family protein [Armatimonadota bacterium]
MSDKGEADPNEPGADDIAARFPKPEEVTTGRASNLPEPPKMTYNRPNLRRDTDPLPEGTKSILANVGSNSRNLRSMGVAGTIGISLAVSIGVGAGLGWLIDTYLLGSPQPPWGLIAGFLLGVFSGFANMIRVANQLNRDSE